MVAFSTKYMLRSILAAFKRRRKKSLARETKTFSRKKGFPGRKTPFAKPFSAFQKLRAAPEIATIYLEQVIKQNDWTLLPIGRHFCLWFYGRARAKEIWALDNRLTNQTKVPFVVQPSVHSEATSSPGSSRHSKWRPNKTLANSALKRPLIDWQFGPFLHALWLVQNFLSKMADAAEFFLSPK